MKKNDIQSTWLLSPEDEIDILHRNTPTNESIIRTDNEEFGENSRFQNKIQDENKRDIAGATQKESSKIRESPLLLNNEIEKPLPPKRSQNGKHRIALVVNTLIAVTALSFSAYTMVIYNSGENRTISANSEKILKLTEQLKTAKLQTSKTEQEIKTIRSSISLADARDAEMAVKLQDLEQQLIENVKKTSTNQEKIDNFKKVRPFDVIIKKNEDTPETTPEQALLPKRALITQVANSIDNVLSELN